MFHNVLYQKMTLKNDGAKQGANLATMLPALTYRKHKFN